MYDEEVAASEQRDVRQWLFYEQDGSHHMQISHGFNTILRCSCGQFFKLNCQATRNQFHAHANPCPASLESHVMFAFAFFWGTIAVVDDRDLDILHQLRTDTDIWESMP